MCIQVRELSRGRWVAEVVGWLGGWVVGWLGGWVAGWLGGWVAGWLVTGKYRIQMCFSEVPSPYRGAVTVGRLLVRYRTATRSDLSCDNTSRYVTSRHVTSSPTLKISRPHTSLEPRPAPTARNDGWLLLSFFLIILVLIVIQDT